MEDSLHLTIHHTIDAPGRCFFVGDIHGHLDALLVELKKVDFEPANGDMLVAVGDLIDRGAQSIAVLSLLDEPWFNSVRGNHEEMALAALPWILSKPSELTIKAKSALKLWLYNGGDWIDSELDQVPCSNGSDAGKTEFTERLTARLRSLPYSLTVNCAAGKAVGVIHAECPVSNWKDLPDVLKEKTVRTEAVWSRTRIDRLTLYGSAPGTTVLGIDAVVCGHTVTPKGPVHDGNTIWIETGVFCTGKLTVIEASEIFSTLGS